MPKSFPRIARQKVSGCATAALHTTLYHVEPRKPESVPEQWKMGENEALLAAAFYLCCCDQCWTTSHTAAEWPKA